MLNYLIRRLTLIIPTLIVVSLLSFSIVRLIPGSVIDLMLAERELISGFDRADLERELGLDQPMLIQYGKWVGNIIQHGNLGKALWRDSDISELISQRLPVTFELAVIALFVGLFISLPIGVYSAIRQDTWGDYIARSFAILCIAMPSFWLGTMVVVLPSVWWQWSPNPMYIPFAQNPGSNLLQFIIPGVVLGMALSGMNMRMVRTMMLEVLRQDYIRTAWSKGLKEKVVVMRHALRNALIPVITIIGLQIPYLIGGTVIIEQIFGLPGIGRLIVDAARQRDYPIISGGMLFFGVAVLAVNLLVDLSYSVLDPRVRYK